jgi:hypothetical protein
MVNDTAMMWYILPIKTHILLRETKRQVLSLEEKKVFLTVLLGSIRRTKYALSIPGLGETILTLGT